MPNSFTYFVFQLTSAFANLFRRNRGMNGMKTIVGGEDSYSVGLAKLSALYYPLYNQVLPFPSNQRRDVMA